MEAFQLAWIAYEGLKLLIVMIVGATVLAKSAEPVAVVGPAPVCFFQESVHESRAFCPGDVMAFTMPEPDEHLMVVRRLAALAVVVVLAGCAQLDYKRRAYRRSCMR